MRFDPDQLRALSAAVTAGSLDGAARALHVTPSAISQRLRALETRTGRVLLVRSKPVRPTTSGKALLLLARQLELLEADAAAALGEDAHRPLPVAVNADSLATWVLPALAPLAATTAFHLRREDEGRTSELLREGEVVAAVTTEATPVAGCASTPLGAMRYRAVAAPAFARRWFPDGVDADALGHAPMLAFDRDDPLQHEFLTRHAGPDARPPTHMVPSSADFAAAVRLGFGWALLPELQLDPGLVELDPGAPTDVALHWQRWRRQSGALEALTRAIVAGARAALVPSGRG
ncbi:MAG: transcriptional regulator ArgP [Solirubrobacterales bacterium]|nr:transcriptional regulator ArgP [Solirubrobacterales bacterium]